MGPSVMAATWLRSSARPTCSRKAVASRGATIVTLRGHGRVQCSLTSTTAVSAICAYAVSVALSTVPVTVLARPSHGRGSR